MTTRYTRIRTNFVSSLASDYSRPNIDEEFQEVSSTDDETPYIPVSVDTTGTTLTLSHLTSLSRLIIYNEDSTNYVTARWFASHGSQAAVATPGWAFGEATDDDTITSPAATLLTNGALAGRYARVSSAENSANDGTFLIQTATSTILTLTAANDLAVVADDNAALIEFLSRNEQRILAGQYIVLTAAHVASNLLLTADTAACMCRVFYAGT